MANQSNNNKKKSYIDSYKSNCTDTTISFDIKFNIDTLNDLIDSNKLETILKIKETKNVNISNIHLHDRNGKIKKYDSILLIKWIKLCKNHYDSLPKTKTQFSPVLYGATVELNVC